MNEEIIINEIEEKRRAKDQFFKYSPQSPIPYEKRSSFDGLNYYPVDLSLRFKIELHKHDGENYVKILDNTGGLREYPQWGEFRFKIDGKIHTLQAYKPNSHEERLWISFKDLTSGKETYGSGRYLDLDENNCKIEDGRWIFDFNDAYNPFCAYNEMYSCPYIPTENNLPIKIEAREKILF